MENFQICRTQNAFLDT